MQGLNLHVPSSHKYMEDENPLSCAGKATFVDYLLIWNLP